MPRLIFFGKVNAGSSKSSRHEDAASIKTEKVPLSFREISAYRLLPCQILIPHLACLNCKPDIVV